MSTPAAPVAAPLVRRRLPVEVRRKRFLIAVANHSLLIVTALIFVAPFIFIVLTSLMTSQQALSPKLWPDPFAWHNFTDVFSKAPMWRYAFNTLLYAGLGTLGLLVSSIPVACALARLRWRGANIVFLITLAFFATGIALLIVTALFRLLGPRNTRVLAQIISALAGASIFLSFQYFNISGRRGMGPMSQDQMAQIIANTNINPKEWWLFPARAFTGDIPSILLWEIVAAIVFPFGVWIFSRSFVADAAAASTMGSK